MIDLTRRPGSTTYVLSPLLSERTLEKHTHHTRASYPLKMLIKMEQI